MSIFAQKISETNDTIVRYYKCFSCDGNFSETDVAGMQTHLAANTSHVIMVAYRHTTGDGSTSQIQINRTDGSSRNLKVDNSDVITANT